MLGLLQLTHWQDLTPHTVKRSEREGVEGKRRGEKGKGEEGKGRKKEGERGKRKGRDGVEREERRRKGGAVRRVKGRRREVLPGTSPGQCLMH